MKQHFALTAEVAAPMPPGYDYGFRYAEPTALETFIRLVYALLPFGFLLFAGIGILMFLYGVIRYVTSEGNLSLRAWGRSFMWYGFFAIVVAFCILGLLLSQAFFVSPTVVT
jgi:hypothetical protein